jgi:hypothetical protein
MGETHINEALLVLGNRSGKGVKVDDEGAGVGGWAASEIFTAAAWYSQAKTSRFQIRVRGNLLGQL